MGMKMVKKKSDDIELTPDDKTIKGVNWFPGHMARALREIKEKMKMVDIVFEVRDARTPLASGNQGLDEILKQKSRLIVFNKTNLAEAAVVREWEEWFQAQKTPFIFIDCFDKAALKKTLKLAHEICYEKQLANLSGTEEVTRKNKLRLMIIGLPNTGKSTLINQFAGRNATRVADQPGHTQVQQWIKIDDELELLDTPGVMPPYMIREEHGLWLGAIHAVPEDVVGVEQTAIFLIHYFKERNSELFKERYKLDSFEGDLDTILLKIATARGSLKQKGLPDLERVFKMILHDFRKGDLGRASFGRPPKK